MQVPDTMHVFEALVELGTAVRKKGKTIESEQLYAVAAALVEDEPSTLVLPRGFMDPKAEAREWVVLSAGRRLPPQ